MTYTNSPILLPTAYSPMTNRSPWSRMIAEMKAISPQFNSVSLWFKAEKSVT